MAYIIIAFTYLIIGVEGIAHIVGKKVRETISETK
jgi:hypothetical protein